MLKDYTVVVNFLEDREVTFNTKGESKKEVTNKIRDFNDWFSIEKSQNIITINTSKINFFTVVEKVPL